MASDNSLSLTLMFDDHLGTYRNFMPVVWIGNGFVDLLLAEPVIILSFE